jgi:hypothetical protein
MDWRNTLRRLCPHAPLAARAGFAVERVHADVISAASPLLLKVTLLCEPSQDMVHAEQIAERLALSFESGAPVYIWAEAVRMSCGCRKHVLALL